MTIDPNAIATYGPVLGTTEAGYMHVIRHEIGHTVGLNHDTLAAPSAMTSPNTSTWAGNWIYFTCDSHHITDHINPNHWRTA